MQADSKRKTLRIRVYGIVQGVGFRPTVSRHAAAAGVTGSVCNKGPYVEIFAQGTKPQLDAFLTLLREKPPRRAVILRLETQDVQGAPVYERFSIVESARTKGEIFLSPDIAVCDECKRELYEPGNRRYLHPFINCTCCGPRLTILDALPYDRERTSMKAFPMCPDCAKEYRSPASRRYDAQPVCCNRCGPEVYLLDRPERGLAAIRAAQDVIRGGGIVAVKGIGGFHLCCDATNEDAVALLRRRKRRPQKPFAVMLRDEAAAQRVCRMTPAQEELLTGHQKPILLLPKREDAPLAPSVAPGNPKVGLMLPYAPVQLLLFDSGDGQPMPDALVMTSGNVSGAPICRDDESARRELGGFTDCILSHNRAIRIRADDTVLDFDGDRPYMIRRSRGYAPLPVVTGQGFQGSVLAVGGELKNAFCVGVNDLFYPSPYIGDLSDVRTAEALRETIGRFTTLLEAQPQLVACDLHPRYNSVAVARELGLPLFPVQHHYAHVLSCMAENDRFAPCLGVSFDGTGYGTDGTIWGGELLRCDPRGFARLGSIRPFLHVGGDAAAREGWRIAVSLLYGATGDAGRTGELARALDLCDEAALRVQLLMADRRLNAVPSTSAGRLFDGVSALLGVRRASTFEGEASMALQFAAEAYETAHPAPPLPELPLLGDDLDGRSILATDALVRWIAERRAAGEDAGYLSWVFHAQLALEIAAACRRARAETGLGTVALTGGCYQNLLLLRLTRGELEAEGFTVLTHSLIPPNDGGLALGQAVAAMAALDKVKS